ncbi:unnamed protein product [Brassica rapa]|uniref:Uncharacterized protein n=1 Tax=Brassica campestris TaxID=3711 RepID=A0A8D9DA91_BRACM|nr:unnamed protein product [Brassica rapa]
MDSHGPTDVRCVLMDTHKQPGTSCVLTDTDGRPMCADGHRRTSCVQTHTNTLTATDVLCVLVDTHGRPVCTEQTAHLGQNHPNSPREGPASRSTGRASVLSPRTSVLICVLMDSHGLPMCADGHTRIATDVLCVLTNTHRRPVHGLPVCADRHTRTSCVHGRPVCASGHPQTSCPHTSCVCWRTPTDVLCVLNRQPTRAKITRTVHKKGQRAESKDQRGDMCTDGQPWMSCVDTHGHTRTATDVLCVLADTHRRPVSTNSPGRPVCAGGRPWTSCVHGRPVCASGHPQTSYSPRGPKSPKQSTGRASVLSPRTNVLICVLMDSHGRHDQHADMCTDGQPRTSCPRTSNVCSRTHTDSHGRPVCADEHPQTQPTWAKITQTVHGKGQRAESEDQRADIVLSPRTNMLICVLMDSHGRHVCADGHRRTHTDTTDSHRCPVCTGGHPRTSCTDVLCVLTDTDGRPVCTDQTARMGQNHPNSPQDRVSVLSPRTNVLICVLKDSHGRPVCADGHRQTHTDSHRRPVCAGGHPQTSCTAHVGQNHPNSPREGPAC